ncbi:MULTISPECIES: acyl-CoA thioesterase [Azorhizobium]|nr:MULTISPECIES: thioesterase family protein [Azorhizobium]TDT96668.1 (3S)-malyl-CoA thioesterase [Azorhizobium sp. AG788]
MTKAEAAPRDAAPKGEREAPALRSSFPHFLPITTRWSDMDVYGHVNNVVYYAYFDTVVAEYLMRTDGVNPHESAAIGLVVETRCSYFQSLTFPETVEAGLRVVKLGNTSVRYEIGIFRQGEDTASAQGYFVHVYVDRDTRRPVPLPEHLKRALAPLVV